MEILHNDRLLNLPKQPEKIKQALEEITSNCVKTGCEDALHNSELAKSFKFDEYTKELQKEPQCTSVSCNNITRGKIRLNSSKAHYE